MKVQIIEASEPQTRRRKSKYDKELRAIQDVLKEYGPDEQFRAIAGSDRWTRARLSKTIQGLRGLTQTHGLLEKHHLALNRCSRSGLVFRWIPVTGQ